VVYARTTPTFACTSVAVVSGGKYPADENVAPAGRPVTTSKNTLLPPQRMLRGPPARPFSSWARRGVTRFWTFSRNWL